MKGYAARLRGKSPMDIAEAIKRKGQFYARRMVNLLREQRRIGWVPGRQVLCGLLRRDLRTGIDFPENVLATWERRATEAFFPGTRDPNFRTVFMGRYPRELETILRAAEGISKGRTILFRSYEVDMGEPINWQSAIGNARSWPSVYFRKIDLQNSERIGDLRTTWELNRHHQWLALAKAYFLVRDDRYFEVFWNQFESWRQSNPFLVGVNWLSAMEVGIRLNHWLSSYSLFRECPKFDVERKIEFFCWVYLHIHFLQYHLTEEDRGFYNNHSIVEAASLYLGCLICREFESSSHQLRKSKEILSEEMRRQFLGDGFHEELCSSYHLQVAGAYLLSAIAAERCGDEIAADWKNAIMGFVRVIQGIAKPDGNLPQLGDGDDGTFLCLDSSRDFLSGRTICDCARIFLRDSHVVFDGERLTEGAFWVFGPDLFFREAELSPRNHSPRTRVLNAAQIAVHQERSENGSNYCLFTAGTKQPSRNNGHRHADLLSVNLHVRDRDVLVDPGTYCYNGPLDFRRYFQSTNAHNTVTLNGRDQFLFRGHFGLRHIHYRSQLATWCGNGVTIFRGAYTDDVMGAWHCRYVLLMFPDLVLIRDHCGENEYAEARLNFILSPRSKVFLERGRLLCDLTGSERIQVDIFSKNDTFADKGKIVDAWYSGSYCVKERCQSIVMNSEGKENFFSTIFRLSDDASYTRRIVDSSFWHSESFLFCRGDRSVSVKFENNVLHDAEEPGKRSSFSATVRTDEHEQQVRYDPNAKHFAIS